MKLTDIVPATAHRVESNTAAEVNEENRRQAEDNVAKYEGASPDAISERIRELEHEWDIERVLEANASTVLLISIGLGAFFNRKWFAFSAVVAAFLLQHAVQGWCPPMVPWRRAGIRTQSEIDQEKTALRILRGDFKATDDGREAFAQAGAA